MPRIRRLRKMPQAEISLTPLIDTALTLLIIFMVATPMIHNSIKVDLPEGKAKESEQASQEIVLVIDKQEQLFCNNQKVTIDTLLPAIQNEVERLKKNQAGVHNSLWIHVDKGTTLTAPTLIEVMSKIHTNKEQMGIKNVVFAMQRPATV
jgi:biopolymer transport protein ExbD